MSVWNVDTDDVNESSPILKGRASSAFPHAFSACFGDGSTYAPTLTLPPSSGAEVTTHEREAQPKVQAVTAETSCPRLRCHASPSSGITAPMSLPVA